MPVPTNLITGFLGVGKTTAVLDLLARKAAGSRWAVLVNEYGEVGIDGSLIEGDAPDGVTVREVGGGCVCCATAPYLGVALHFLLVDAQPDRLLIETTGLGHPAKLLDTLRANYRDRLDVRATLGLVDPADFVRPGMFANPVFREQVELADVLVLNKLDAAGPGLVADFQAWAEALYPPKLLIVATERGRLDPGWLDLASETGARAQEAHADPRPLPLGSCLPEARGWTFPTEVVFDRDRVVALLSAPGLVRAKGVFRTPHDWLAVNRAREGPPAVAPTAYRRDSRVEAFAEAPDWAAFERELRACVLAPR
jgi:G3E family GTPase